MMKQMKHKWQKFWNDNGQPEDGFTLLELLLSLGVITIIIMSLVQISNNWSKSQQERLVARHMAIVTAAAEAFINNRFTEVFNATAGGPIDIPLDNIATPHGLFLKENGIFLPAAFNATNNMNQVASVIVRRVSVTPNRVEAVVVTGGRLVDDNRLMNVARLLSEKGGFITAIPRGSCTAATICSVANSWSTNLANFTGTAWRTANTATVAGGGFLASYIGEVEASDGVGPYMYRSEIIAGNPNPNTMRTDLDMNGNTIIGADDVATDSIVAGNLNVIDGNLLIDFGLVATGNVTAAGLASADNVRVVDTTINDNLDIGAAGTLNATNISGSVASIDTLNVTNNLTVPDVSALNLDMPDPASVASVGSLQATSMNVATTTAPSLLSVLVTANTMSASNNMSVLDNSEVNNLSVTGTLNIENANISNLNCTGAGC